MATAKASPRVYAACLASYNSGRLHGAWIECEGKTGDDLRSEIGDMLAKSPCPNVMRRKCTECGAWHTDARPYRENSDECSACGEPLPADFVQSAEEWAIHDHEGFAGLISSEWPDLDDVAALVEALADDGDKRRGLQWLVGGGGYTLADAIERCEDVRTFSSDRFNLAADYAEELASETVENFEERAGQWPFNCIDWEAAGRELLMGGDICEVEGDGERYLITNAAEF